MTETGQDLALQLEHRYDAPREKVFEAWTNPEVLKRWWAAAPTAARGGRRARRRQLPPLDAHRRGRRAHRRRRVPRDQPARAPRLHVALGGGPEPAMAGSEDTLVVVEFHEDGDGTLVKLTHSGFASEEIKGMHAHGWEAVLANLERNVFSS